MLRLVRTASIVCVSAVAMCGSSVTAQPGGNGDIVIAAPQSAGMLDTNQRAVPYSDLALNRENGRNVLLRRVSFAIASLCDEPVASSNPVNTLKCSAVAWNNVRPQLDQLLRR